jgi:DNA (cytosine-5)-methyltransferase 1|tara:strand:+ start:10755 stop:11759 length:1005 start_codon:yes stop_codon:yes gene_type:complete
MKRCLHPRKRKKPKNKSSEIIIAVKKDTRIRFIDLFAGIGGMRLPFDDLGCECVFSSEIDKFCIKTYESNFNEIPHGDITEIDESNIPPHDLLLAGFPCQAFSNAGLRKGFDDTRGTLFFDIARVLNHHKPQAFLLENVKGLLSHDNGRTIRIIDKTLQDLGYWVKMDHLNAKDFGLPQNRERVFLVGFRDAFNFQFPIPTMESTMLGDILQKRVANKYTISDKIWTSHKLRKEKARAKGHGFGYSLFDRKSEYTSTISSRYYKDGSEILIEQKNKNPRMLTPREAARLQGFPEEFIIPVSDTQAYRQFGNAVPVNVIRHLAKEISEIFSQINS